MHSLKSTYCNPAKKKGVVIVRHCIFAPIKYWVVLVVIIAVTGKV